MSIEFVGILGTRAGSEAGFGNPRANTLPIDKGYTRELAHVHEKGGFDSVLIGYFGSGVESVGVASYAAAHTNRLRFLIAHRPGVVSPTLAARTFATLDHFSDGRVALNIVSGLAEADQRREGDFHPREERYERTGEYLDVLTQAWASPKPFDHWGRYYRFEQAISEVKPYQRTIPLYISGASDGAIEVNARFGDVYMLWGEPLADAAERITKAKRAAAAVGREVGISVSLRPILGRTESEAWERAHDLTERVASQRARAGLPPATAPDSVGGQRLFGFANEADVFDKRLYTGIARLTGASGNSTALVGTPEQVAESILAYYDIGATTILIRGYDVLNDAIGYGRDLLPLVRAEVAKRERERLAVAG